MTKSWIFLIVGIIAEVAGTTGMRALVHSHPMLSQLSATVGIIFAYFCVSRGVEKFHGCGLCHLVRCGDGRGISLLSAMFFDEAHAAAENYGLWPWSFWA